MLFKDKYFFLSNFYPVSVTIDINGNKITFKNSEAAFQAQKNFELADKKIRDIFYYITRTTHQQKILPSGTAFPQI